MMLPRSLTCGGGAPERHAGQAERQYREHLRRYLIATDRVRSIAGASLGREASSAINLTFVVVLRWIVQR